MKTKPTYSELEKRIELLEQQILNNQRTGSENLINKENLKALQESEERFRLAFHTSPDAINLNRVSDGVYIDVNQGFTNLLGYTCQEVKGKSSLSLNIWENPDDRKRLVDALTRNGHVENLEARLK